MKLKLRGLPEPRWRYQRNLEVADGGRSVAAGGSFTFIITNSEGVRLGQVTLGPEECDRLGDFLFLDR